MISDAELIRRALDSRQLEIETSTIGRVEDYDPITRTADVRPLVKRPIPTATGEIVHEELPILPGIPVLFPGAGYEHGAVKWAITWPIEKASTGLVITLKMSAARWRESPPDAAPPPVEPGDTRPHHIANTVFIPGLWPDKAASPSTAVSALCVVGEEIRLGSHLAAELVAIASYVEDRIQTIVDAISSAEPLANDGGAQLKAQILSAISTAWGGTTVPAVGSSKVKVEP